MNAEIIYYTDMKLRGTKLFEECQKTVENSGLPIVSVSLNRKCSMGRNVMIHARRSQSTLYTQILLGLVVSDADYVFFCEHDVLYHPSYFKFVPPTDDKYYYNSNAYKYRLSDRKVVTYDSGWLSQLCANRELLIEHYTKRFRRIAQGFKEWGYEPGSGQSRKIDRVESIRYRSKFPNIDVRHGGNWTGVSRMDPREFKDKKTCQNFKEVSVSDIPGWGEDFLLSL